MEKNKKELDLLQMFSVSGQWFVNLGKMVARRVGDILRLLFRKRVLFIIILSLFVGISQYMARPSARYYEVGAMLRLSGTNVSTFMALTQKLQDASPRFGETSLSHQMGLPRSLDRKVMKIKAFYVIDYMNDSVPDIVDFSNSHSYKDTMNVRSDSYVYLAYQVRGVEYADTVGKLLLSYYNESEMMKSSFNIYKINLLEQISICDVELARLDSLANILYFKSKDVYLNMTKSGIVLGDNYKQLVYGDRLKIAKMKGEIAHLNTLATAPVVAVSDFVVNPLSVNRRVVSAIYGGLLAVLFTLILGLFVENYRKIMDFLKSRE